MTAATNVSRLPVRTDTLYALTQGFRSVLASLDSEDTSVEDVAAELSAIAGTITDKAEGVACVTADLEHRATACRDEAKRLLDRARIAEMHAEWLRAYVLDNMKELGLTKLETPRFTLAIRANPPSVTVLDASQVPGEFQRSKVLIDVDKRAIAEHYKTTGELCARHGDYPHRTAGDLVTTAEVLKAARVLYVQNRGGEPASPVSGDRGCRPHFRELLRLAVRLDAKSLARFNDVEVLAAFDQAIALAEGSES